MEANTLDDVISLDDLEFLGKQLSDKMAKDIAEGNVFFYQNFYKIIKLINNLIFTQILYIL